MRASPKAISRSRGGAPGPSGGSPRMNCFLEGALALAEHRERERRARAEAAEQRALADAGGLGDVVHRDAAGAALGEQPLSRAEDPLAVARRVGALVGASLDQGRSISGSSTCVSIRTNLLSGPRSDYVLCLDPDETDYGPETSNTKEHTDEYSHSTSQLATGTWKIDTVHSHVGFAVKHMVVSTFRGRFEDYNGELHRR